MLTDVADPVILAFHADTGRGLAEGLTVIVREGVPLAEVDGDSVCVCEAVMLPEVEAVRVSVPVPVLDVELVLLGV